MRKSLLYISAFSLLLGFSAFTFYHSTNWKIAEGYSIKFISENPEGVFTDLKGEIVFDDHHVANSKFNMVIDAASINTGNGMKNKHAKSADWLDVEKFPTITFKSTRVENVGAAFQVTGKLNIHAVEKEITFPFTFENKVFKGSFEVNRFDYGLSVTKMPAGKAAHVLKVEVSVPVTL